MTLRMVGNDLTPDPMLGSLYRDEMAAWGTPARTRRKTAGSRWRPGPWRPPLACVSPTTSWAVPGARPSFAGWRNCGAIGGDQSAGARAALRGSPVGGIGPRCSPSRRSRSWSSAARRSSSRRRATPARRHGRLLGPPPAPSDPTAQRRLPRRPLRHGRAGCGPGRAHARGTEPDLARRHLAARFPGVPGPRPRHVSGRQLRQCRRRSHAACPGSRRGPEVAFYAGLSHLLAGSPSAAAGLLDAATRSDLVGDDARWFGAVARERLGEHERALGALGDLCARGGPRAADACRVSGPSARSFTTDGAASRVSGACPPRRVRRRAGALTPVRARADAIASVSPGSSSQRPPRSSSQTRACG